MIQEIKNLRTKDNKLTEKCVIFLGRKHERLEKQYKKKKTVQKPDKERCSNISRSTRHFVS